LLSRSLIPFDPNQALITVVELSKKNWLVAGIIPGVERQPLKKLAADENELSKLLERWRAEAEKAGHKITRIALAFETGRDGFWLTRCLVSAVSRPMSFMRLAWRCRANTGVPRPTGSTPSSSSAPFGLAARRAQPLQGGHRPDLRRGRCTTPPPRARDPRWRANHDQFCPGRDFRTKSGRFLATALRYVARLGRFWIPRQEAEFGSLMSGVGDGPDHRRVSVILTRQS
jgi:hypothetical protein